MKISVFNIVMIVIFGICCIDSLIAKDAVLGSEYPSGRKGDLELALGAFRNLRNEINNKSLVVMIRNGTYFILNHQENADLLDEFSVKGDAVLFEDAARTFLAWQARAAGTAPNWREIAQSPVVELGVFLRTNPDIAAKMFVYKGIQGTGLGELDATSSVEIPKMAKNPTVLPIPGNTSESTDFPSALWYFLSVLALALLVVIAITVRKKYENPGMK